MKKEVGKNTPKNPDIEYVAGFNRLEYCEVKCNLQTTVLSENSIINVLKGAKSQLPKGRAGLILLRIPENWIKDMERGTSVVGKAVEQFIKTEKTTRVSSIFIIVSETVGLDHQRTAQIFGIKEFQNPHCDKRSGITIPDLSRGTPNWRELRAVAESELRLATL